MASKYIVSDGWRFDSLKNAKEWADKRSKEDSWCSRVYSVSSLETGHVLYTSNTR